MKFKNLLTKTLLVAAGLCVGASAWADEITATLDHTAGAQWGSNTGVSTVDAEKEHYNNDASSAWAGCAYAKFSFTIPAGHSITSATLTYSVNQGGKSGRNDIIYYMSKDFDLDWANFAGKTGTDLRNTASRAGQAVASAATGGTGDRINLSQSVTAAVKAIAEADQAYIIFQWTGNAGGADLYGKASVNKPILTITTTNEVLYTATFNEANSVETTVNIYSDSERTLAVSNGQLHANTTYYYTATAAGYEANNGSFAVETENPTVNYTMTALPRYTFTVNAVNSVGGAVIKNFVTDADSYEGKAYHVNYPKYLTGDGNIVTYSKDDNTYGQDFVSASADATKTVSYTAYDGVAYFFEGESYAGLGTKTASDYYSNGSAGRGLSGTIDIATIPAAGTYDLSYAVCSNSVGTDKETTYNFYKNNSENVIETVTDLNHSVNAVKSTGTRSVNDITFAVGDILQFNATETKTILDYVLLELKSVTTSAIPTSTFATISSAAALDFANATDESSNKTLKAYVVSALSKDAATLTEVTEAPANTGVILVGTAGQAYTIPVLASASAVGTNYLKAAVTATAIDANAAYILQSGLFHKVTEASTVPAGKAYLLASDVPASAPSLSFVFDDEMTTGINAVKGAAAINGAVYNLNGQRVAQPTKGLYIVNGKKVVLK